MNIGIYVDNIGNQEQMKNLHDFVNMIVLKNNIEDVSIFYDNVGYNQFNIKCGFFNATDLWHFNGTLITTSIETTKNALNIVNKIDIIYLYNKKDRVNIFDLLSIAKNNDIKIICYDEDSHRELHRLTNESAYGVADLNDILNLIGA